MKWKKRSKIPRFAPASLRFLHLGPHFIPLISLNSCAKTLKIWSDQFQMSHFHSESGMNEAASFFFFLLSNCNWGVKTNNGGMAKAWMAGGGGDLTLTGGICVVALLLFWFFPLWTKANKQTNKSPGTRRILPLLSLVPSWVQWPGNQWLDLTLPIVWRRKKGQKKKKGRRSQEKSGEVRGSRGKSVGIFQGKVVWRLRGGRNRVDSINE